MKLRSRKASENYQHDRLPTRGRNVECSRHSSLPQNTRFAHGRSQESAVAEGESALPLLGDKGAAY